ncbi:MAG: PaaI family thioesterase [Alphaproteobacteria bacterium]|nr:PaaI family thioesterase [Alphaproteobacteria bacterium]
MNDKSAQAAERPDVTALMQDMPFAKALRLTFELTDHRLITRLNFGPDHIGNTTLPALHGGVVASTLEHAALIDYLWRCRPAEAPQVATRTISYHRPSGPRDLLAEARLTRQGRRTAHLLVEAWQDDRDRLVASASVHLLLS